MQTFEVTHPYLNQKCGLAEGPLWEKDKNILRFVDIVGKAAYRVELDKGSLSLASRRYDFSIGVTAEVEGRDDVFLFAGKSGIGIASKEGHGYSLIHKFWSQDEIDSGLERRMRANDGAVDSQGRFWVGVLCDPLVGKFAPEGILFRFGTDGSVHRVLTGVTIPNGISWTRDDKTMYFTDSGTASIYAYDFDAASGSISNKRLFYKTEEEGVVPDGHAQDVDGNLWVALWGGWRVVRITPAGKITAEIKLPTRCITAVAFAGEDVYITSERDPEAKKYPESARFHGGVFECHVGIQGKELHKARIPV